MLNKLRQLIQNGEGLTVEFKRCEKEISSNVYETVSAFSNRYGGYILLGVEDNGEVSGVNPEAVAKIKKDFANSLNNPQRFAPTLFLVLEEAELDGKIILWCYVPPDSQVVLFSGKIYDRAVDGDMDITRNSMMVTQIHQRKMADYSERKVFPYAKEKDFEFDRLMPKVRRLATNRLDNHPWASMTNMEIIQSAGLYQESLETGKSGYNLAAVLLFGRDEVIRSCTANYVTDAICRRENLDRYDDRLMVTSNLLDAYDQLIEFITKHTLDRFFLIESQSVSVRSKIARELVSNTLVHREYTSAYPAKIIIERDRIVTENWSLPRTPGRIDPHNFTPYPKNPLLANFFVNIGRADVLGSGVRNLYEFTKIYSGGEPELIEGDIFRTVIPLNKSNSEVIDKTSDNVSDKQPMNDKTSDNEKIINKTLNKDHCQAILAYLDKYGEINATTTASIIKRSHGTARRVLSQLVNNGCIVATGANRNRKYRTLELK
ncbi:MAG: putative DNA binding domain-containing protein [Synergistaceae bacterium]|nr:putative DNA binding domain-containing protein [Synergistaceae bacterium]